MKKIMAGWAVAAVLAAAGSLVAHHSLTQFDTSTAVTVKGTIVVIERVNPHSFIFLDQTTSDGQTQRWALEGPGPMHLSRMGIERDTLKVGDVIEACGYVTNKGIKSERTFATEPISLSLKATMSKSVSGRVLTAEMLVTSDGKKRTWSDYGHHKCLGPDYQDIHVR